MGNAEPPRSALCLLRPHGFGGEKSIYEYKVHLLIMEIGAVGGIEPPLGTLPPLGIYRVEQSIAL